MHFIEGLKDLMTREKFSGVVYVKKNNEIVYQGSMGYSDIANKVPNNFGTKFGIASGTKLFTALCIGKLIDKGLITLDTKFKSLIDRDFDTYDDDITIKHLLTHSAGIPDYFDEDEIEDINDVQLSVPWNRLLGPKEYFDLFPNKPMKWEPGEVFSYSNSSYVLLAAIIEVVSGMTYKEFLERELFAPLGMSDTGLYMMNKLPANTANGYIFDEEEWKTNIYNVPIIAGGDGGAFSTIDDYNKLWKGLLDYRILSKELTETYIEKHINVGGANRYYGLGIWLYDDGADYIRYVNGHDAGISFKSAIINDIDTTYTVISNTSDGTWPIAKYIQEYLLTSGKD